MSDSQTTVAVRYEGPFEGEENLSPLAWLGIGTGVSIVMGLIAYGVTRRDDERPPPDSSLSRPRFGSLATSEGDALAKAVADDINKELAVDPIKQFRSELLLRIQELVSRVITEEDMMRLGNMPFQQEAAEYVRLAKEYGLMAQVVNSLIEENMLRLKRVTPVSWEGSHAVQDAITKAQKAWVDQAKAIREYAAKVGLLDHPVRVSPDEPLEAASTEL